MAAFIRLMYFDLTTHVLLSAFDLRIAASKTSLIATSACRARACRHASCRRRPPYAPAFDAKLTLKSRRSGAGSAARRRRHDSS